MSLQGYGIIYVDYAGSRTRGLHTWAICCSTPLALVIATKSELVQSGEVVCPRPGAHVIGTCLTSKRQPTFLS